VDTHVGEAVTESAFHPPLHRRRQRCAAALLCLNTIRDGGGDVATFGTDLRLRRENPDAADIEPGARGARPSTAGGRLECRAP
jgi:hypothetical protein